MIAVTLQKYLLQLSRRAIEKYLNTQEILLIDPDALSSVLLKKQATFVTLTLHNDLRGCMGELEPQKPLYQSVIDNSLASAFLDPRFPPLSNAELQQIKIEISLLSPLQKVPSFTKLNQLLNYLKQKQPGLVIKKGNHQATFLPQVWEELPQPTEFLSQLCLKAGLPKNEWEKLDLEMKEYTVEKFKEN